MSLLQITKLIRGEKGTTVRLQVIPADSKNGAKSIVVELVRDRYSVKANGTR